MDKVFQKGELILKEGAPGNDAFFIRRGRVRVFSSAGGSRVELAVLGENQIFGEMSMIDDRPRSASVEALEETEATVINPDEFNALVYSDPELLKVFMRHVFERLRNMDKKVIDALIGSAAESYLEGRIVIEGLTEEAAAALEGKSRAVSKYPFKVGRKTENFMKDIFSNNDLYLEDRRPFNVSRNHFSVQSKGGKFYVIDRGSTLGTCVNESRIGGPAANTEAELLPGENIVAAGSPDSPFRFRVILS